MLNKKTLYISDLDGTLLNSSAQVSDKTADIINGLIGRGMMFTVATARSFVSAGKIISKLNLSLPIASYNGVFLVNPKTGAYFEKCVFDKKLIAPAIKKIIDNDMRPIVYSLIGGDERASWISGRGEERFANYFNDRKGDKRFRPVNSYDELFSGDIFSILLIGSEDDIPALKDLYSDDPHMRKYMYKYIYSHIQSDTYYKDEYWLEAYRFDATKERAARKIKDITGAEELVCFGDNLNDLPLFAAADRKYAVSNAVDELKRAADGIIGSNENDGVAEWLLKNA